MCNNAFLDFVMCSLNRRGSCTAFGEKCMYGAWDAAVPLGEGSWVAFLVDLSSDWSFC